MAEIDTSGINEQLHFPDMGVSDEQWYHVALSGGVLAVKSDFASIEDTILDALEAENHGGKTFGEAFELKLVPGELDPEAITCLYGIQARLFDTSERKRVVFLAKQVERLPQNVLRDFSLGLGFSQEPTRKSFRLPEGPPPPTLFDTTYETPSTKAA